MVLNTTGRQQCLCKTLVWLRFLLNWFRRQGLRLYPFRSSAENEPGGYFKGSLVKMMRLDLGDYSLLQSYVFCSLLCAYLSCVQGDNVLNMSPGPCLSARTRALSAGNTLAHWTPLGQLQHEAEALNSHSTSNQPTVIPNFVVVSSWIYNTRRLLQLRACVRATFSLERKELHTLATQPNAQAPCSKR